MSDYIHRIGRVGRVGSLGASFALSYICKKWDVELLWKIEVSCRLFSVIDVNLIIVSWCFSMTCCIVKYVTLSLLFVFVQIFAPCGYASAILCSRDCWCWKIASLGMLDEYVLDFAFGCFSLLIHWLLMPHHLHKSLRLVPISKYYHHHHQLGGIA